MCRTGSWGAVCPRVMHACAYTGFGALRAGPSAADRERVARAVARRGGPAVPHNFAPTAPGHDGKQRRGAMPQHAERNPQVACPRVCGIVEES